MLNIPGYTIDEVIHTSSHSTVCRGRRDDDGARVILKFIRAAVPKTTDIARFNREYAILQRLVADDPAAWVIRVRHESRLALVTEDTGGRSLAQCLSGRALSLREFLGLSLQIVDSLAAIHKRHILHKDINPSNIIWNPDTGELKIIDFNISSTLEREAPTIRNLNILEGTLTYIAPEQTGRMNRSVDYRADLYSLGATLYELLTGDPPFTTRDVTELIHAHLAVAPTPPHEVDERVPQVVSQVVMKLLTKEPAGRYQSTRSLRADLQECLRRLDANGFIESFEIARSDVAEVFRLPERLYGRHREIEELKRTFDEVCSGSLAMTLVYGYSGIGKSSLVHELYKPITRERGRFISGKYDQYRRNVPYSGVVAAFQELVRELLTEPEDVLAAWRAKLLRTFGTNGAVITEVISEVEHIVGPQPPIPPLGPTEAQNRFNRVFLSFIHELCQPGHPLVLFLDDLQWADSASLKFLELMMTSGDLGHLHLVGAYRDNEVTPSHPLMILLQRLERQHKQLQTIQLSPLDLGHITCFLADALNSQPDAVGSLAALVDQKTSGNPFFVNQFLTTLYRRGALTVDRESRSWKWDPAEVEALGLTDNVVDLMVGRVKLLPKSTSNILRIAACIGNRFDVATLAIIQQESAASVHRELFPAISEGFIVPLTRPEPTDEGMDAQFVAYHYRFMHDRVQQAAHSLLDPGEMKAAHYEIGRLLLQNLSPTERAERVFQIADHLNLSRDLAPGPDALLELARLNLEAGSKAKDATAYSAARWYLEAGMQCLPANAWHEHYELTVALHRHRGEVEYLNGNFEESNALFDLLMEKVATPLEQAEICSLLITLYTLSANYAEALEMGRNALSLVGVELPSDDLEAAFQAELERARINVGGRRIASLVDLPETQLRDKRMAIKLLSKVGPLAYMGDQQLFPVVTIRSVNLSIEHGHLAESAVGYCNYGLILSARLHDYASSYEFGLLAQRVSEKFHNTAQKCVSSMMVGCVLNHWVNPVSAAEPHYDEAYHAGLDSGEYLWVGYLFSWKIFLDHYQGKEISQILEESERSLAFCRQANHQMASLAIIGVRMLLSNLADEDGQHAPFRGEEMDDAEFLAFCEDQQENTVICYYLTTRASVNYVKGHYLAALADLQRAERLLQWIPSTIVVAEHNFYHSLVLAALHRDAGAGEQVAYEAAIARNQQQMRVWMESCPENFENRYLLVEAELARVRGAGFGAIEPYNQALQASKTHGFIHNYALVNERITRLWMELGNPICARAHLIEALRAYEAWGVRCKVTSLIEEHALLLEASEHSSASATFAGRSTKVTTRIGAPLASTTFPDSSFLDVATVIKASQAISSEIVLESLLKRLLAIVLENVGAERGYVIMSNDDGELQIEAGGTGKESPSDTLAYPLSLDSVDPATGHPLLPQTIINYASRTGAAVVLRDASSEGMFTTDPYVIRNQPRSLMCTPITSRGQQTGLLYLENNLVAGAFTAARVNALELLTSQISIALKNAYLYRENEKARFAAEAANRAKSTFLATMSHELRTPLNVIIGYAELICEEAEDWRETDDWDPAGLIDDLDKIRASGHHLMSVLGSILDLAKIEDGHIQVHREVFDVRELLDELKDSVQPLLVGGNNSFSMACDGSVQEIYTDKLMLRQALMNFLSNACKFTSNGAIRIEVQPSGADGKRTVDFRVSDTGIGIPDDQLERIFDAFVQVDSSTTREFEGAGLGLTICRSFVETLGGFVTANSVEGEGSSFTVHIPVPEPR